jgi:DNA-3-methyladenine glycosylase I
MAMVTPSEYATVFKAIDSNLLSIWNKSPRREELFRRLDAYKAVAEKTFDDADYYRMLVHVVFFSGFKAVIVSKKMPTIDEHFPDYKTVAGYGEKELDAIAEDPLMIRNIKKIEACRDNAKTLKDIVARNGSFSRYVESFAPKASFENLMRLREDLIQRFRYLGGVTSLHFLMDIGMPVVKPDLTVMRMFHRLGIIEHEKPTEKNIRKAISEAERVARDTGEPIRYIDVVFSSHAMTTITGDGLSQGICGP